MNSKNISILALTMLIAFVGICTLISDWGLRQELFYYRNWKETYDSGYCPTCGQPLNITSEVEDGNDD